MLNDNFNISQYEILDLLYEYQVAKSKLELFSKKYSMDFDSFEKHINTTTIENFDEWDDYIEWKAYNRILIEKSKMVKEINHASYQLS